MKTTHELARELLAGPDIRCIVATRTDPDHPAADPELSLGEGCEDPHGGDFEEFIEIHAATEQPALADATVELPPKTG